MDQTHRYLASLKDLIYRIMTSILTVYLSVPLLYRKSPLCILFLPGPENQNPNIPHGVFSQLKTSHLQANCS